MNGYVCVCKSGYTGENCQTSKCFIYFQMCAQLAGLIQLRYFSLFAENSFSFWTIIAKTNLNSCYSFHLLMKCCETQMNIGLFNERELLLKRARMQKWRNIYEYHLRISSTQWPGSGSIIIHFFRNTTNKSIVPVKVFDSGLKVLNIELKGKFWQYLDLKSKGHKSQQFGHSCIFDRDISFVDYRTQD